MTLVARMYHLAVVFGTKRAICPISGLASALVLNDLAVGAFLLPDNQSPLEQTMKNVFVIVGIFALAVSFAPLQASAQGRSGGNGGGIAASRDGELRGLNRADQVAGDHGARGRAIARTRGANAKAFCPPGQRKKAGLGSRFRC